MDNKELRAGLVKVLDGLRDVVDELIVIEEAKPEKAEEA